MTAIHLAFKENLAPRRFSFKLGVVLHDALKRHNKNATINLYLSDLIGIKGGNDERRKITQDIQHHQRAVYIPMAYQEILAASEIPLEKIAIHLQSKGNDHFRKILRRTRSGVEQLKSTSQNYIHEVFSPVPFYRRSGAILVDHSLSVRYR